MSALRRYRPYPTYKDSGVEWLGEIPAHWHVTPMKHVADFINGFAFKPDEWGLEGTPIIRIENLNGGENFNYTTRQLPAKYCADKGDLLFGWSGNRGTSFGPFLWWRHGTHYVNQHIFRIVDYKVDTMWMYWTLRGVTFYVEKQAHGIIGMVHVTRSELGTIPIPVVPPKEQMEIAHFLEREHKKIDELMAKKERLIALLQEQRTALITRAVTKGLDPNVPMKDSGVDWLGEIPAHWEAKPLKRGVAFLEGPGIMAADFVNDGVPLLRIAGIGKRTATLEGCNYLSPDLVRRRWEHFRVREGDLLISGSASTGFCSEVDMETEGAVPYTGIIIIRPRAGTTEKVYLRWFFLSRGFLMQTELARSGSAIQHFGPSHLSRMWMVVPPISEQLLIAAFLDRETARIDALVAKVRDAIERLKELRTALITAAVTGKIDVREEVA